MPVAQGRFVGGAPGRLTVALLTFNNPEIGFPAPAQPAPVESDGLTLGGISTNYAIPGGAPASQRVVPGAFGNGARMVWGSVYGAPTPVGYPSDYWELSSAMLTFSVPAVLSGDLTVEGWFLKDVGYNGSGVFVLGASFRLSLDASVFNVNGLLESVSGYVEPRGVWNHVALMRLSGVWYAFMNGVRVAQLTGAAGVLTVGALSVGDFTTGPFASSIDNVRLSATARYAPAGFTPPVAPFVSD